MQSLQNKTKQNKTTQYEFKDLIDGTQRFSWGDSQGLTNGKL